MKGYKYSVLGASVLVIEASSLLDTVTEERIPEAIRSLADADYGAGASTVVLVEPVKLPDLTGDNSSLSPHAKTALAALLKQQSLAETTLVRAFFDSGDEIDLCPVSLCAVADYLFKSGSQKNIKLLTGVSNQHPSIHQVYRDLNENIYNAALGQPTHLPEHMVTDLYGEVSRRLQNDSAIEVICPTVKLNDEMYDLTFYAVFFGEPFLVCFVGGVLPEDQIDLFSDIFEQSLSVQSNLFQQIVSNFNPCEDMALASDLAEIAYETDNIFDSKTGINVVFARVNTDNSIDARFFRRKTCTETRLSGTGAAAASYVAHSLNMLSQSTVQVRGMINMNQGRHAAIVMQQSGGTWWFEAPVNCVWIGDIRVQGEE